jgi:hypothetical protein
MELIFEARSIKRKALLTGKIEACVFHLPNGTQEKTETSKRR